MASSQTSISDTSGKTKDKDLSPASSSNAPLQDAELDVESAAVIVQTQMRAFLARRQYCNMKQEREEFLRKSAQQPCLRLALLRRVSPKKEKVVRRKRPPIHLPSLSARSEPGVAKDSLSRLAACYFELKGIHSPQASPRAPPGLVPIRPIAPLGPLHSPTEKSLFRLTPRLGGGYGGSGGGAAFRNREKSPPFRRCWLEQLHRY